MSTKYEVQEFTLCGWTNNWSDEDGNPTVFSSVDHAQAELEWFLEEMREEVEAGNLEDCPDREDFRIVEVA